MQAITLPHQFSFIQCHSYLDNEQLIKIKLALDFSDREKQNIIHKYEKKFANFVGDGYATSFASGRMAFYVALKNFGIGKGDEVILTAFTCSVMANAIIKIGAKPVYADMDRNTFGSSATAIEQVLTKRTKVIVAQHSFGIPCDIDQIINLAKDRGIFVIEDCAISFDSSIDGIKVGNWGDAAIFSTDHSKPLNTIIGGMLYTRNLTTHNNIERLAQMSLSLSREQQNNLYEQILFERKHFIPSRYPRAKIFSFLKNVWRLMLGFNRNVFMEDNYSHLVSSPESYPYPASMPAFLAMLGIIELDRWDEQKKQRRQMLTRFIDELKKSKLSGYVPGIYDDRSRIIVPLRFVFSYVGSEGLLRKLVKYIDINWIWFRQPIACAVDGMQGLHYGSHSCPVSEEICLGIVNLPCNVVAGSEDMLVNDFAGVLNS